jgi:vesicle coat complex subunit
VVKLFLKKPGSNQALVQKVLQAATAENDNPDIRDRAYVYWRLLSSDPEIAKVRDFRSEEFVQLLIAVRTLFCLRSPPSRLP